MRGDVIHRREHGRSDTSRIHPFTQLLKARGILGIYKGQHGLLAIVKPIEVGADGHR